MWTYLQYRRILLFCLLLFSLTACTVRFGTPTAATPIAAPDGSEDFSASLMVAIMEHDYDQLHALMGDSFALANWRAEGSELPPAVALVELRNHYLTPTNAVAFKTDQDLSALLDGTDPLAMWGATVNAVRAIYVTGLGIDGQDEAILIVAQKPDGPFYWHGMVVAVGGFGPAVAAPTITATLTTLPIPPTAVPPTALPTTAPTVVPTVAPTVAPPTSALQRIQFAPGAVSKTIAGDVQAPNRNRYVLRAMAGQEMTVEIASPGQVVNFAVSGVDDGQPYKRLDNEDRFWSGSLPATQDYLITVVTAHGNPAYLLTVTVITPAAMPPPVSTPMRIRFAPGAISETIPGTLASGATAQYVLGAAAGQSMTVTVTSPGNDLLFSIPGLVDGVTSWTGMLPSDGDYFITLLATSDTSYTLAVTIE